MREIRELSLEDVRDYREITFMAYPVKDFSPENIAKYEEDVKNAILEDDTVKYYGVFDQGRMVGAMRLFDFEMNCFGKLTPVLGLGFLAVSLTDKKKKIARSMVEYYEDLALKRAMPIATLLPFRPDFYKNMGYGIGTKMNQYRVDPKYIKKYEGPKDLRHISTDEDYRKMLKCHDQMVLQTHGMVRKYPDIIKDITEDDDVHVVASFDKEENIEGYLAYRFINTTPGNHYGLEIYTEELTYTNKDAMAKILGFLRDQEDQVQRIVINSKLDDMHLLFDNPLNDSWNYIFAGNLESNTQSIGTMYNILDIKAAFKQLEHRNFNNLNLNLKIKTIDDYDSSIKDELIVNFKDGFARFDSDSHDLTIRLKHSDFSALFMGSTSIMKLYNLGLLEISDPDRLKELDLGFYCPEKPISNVNF